MAIDNIAQLGRMHQSGAAAKPAASSPVPQARQELPGSGESVPPVASGADVQAAVSRLNDYVQNLRRDLQFRVDEQVDRVVVTVVDSESGAVIRQIPSEEMLAVARSVEQMQGLLLDEKA
jgi:flagellar protein FlaG